MRRALEYSLGLGITLAQHCEVTRLTEGAVMHEGACCSRLGLPGWPSIAEELMVHRDIELCRLTGGRVHLLHLSTAAQRRARAGGQGRRVCWSPPRPRRTTSASPTTLLAGYDPVYKVNPPLRDGVRRRGDPSRARRRHDRRDRDRPRTARTGDQGAAARPGAARDARPRDRARRGARSPRHGTRPTSSPRCRGSRRRSPASPTATGGRSSPGEPANITVFDPDVEWEVQPARLASKSRNTPYVGTALRGRVRHTISTATRWSSTEHPNDEWIYSHPHEHAPTLRSVCFIRRQTQSEADRSGVGAVSSGIREGCSVLADGSVFEGEMLGC